MKPFLLSSCLLLFCPLVGQPLPEFVGTFKDSIGVDGTTHDTFSAYIPSGLEPNKESPVLFIFDPGGRGKSGITAFVEVAEAHNFLLICSNNAKNGPYGTNLEIADRLFKTVFATYSIDKDRIYTAGFSGGSRLAATIAVLSGAIQGVIACGAGFAKHPLYFPKKGERFSYAGIVGNKDMNYREMQRTVSWLESMDISNELFVFEGEHRWPPSEIIFRAFDWLQEELYRKGVEAEDELFRQKQFENLYSRARDFESQEQLVKAVKEIDRLIRYYPDMISTDSLQKSLRKLQRDRRFKKEKTFLQKIASLEDTLERRIRDRFNLEVSMAKSPDDFRWWDKTLTDLKETYGEHEREEYQQMAYRLQRQIFASAVETMDSYLRQKKSGELDYLEQLLLHVAPQNPYTHYQLARKYAILNSRDKALQHLEKVLELGWNDKTLFKRTSEFEALKETEAFRVLLGKY
ncbi:hypothetical protein SAMN06265375_101702 [Muriicola jejuensis]|uniref:Alpha/beta hydrolase n=1 Tax=Muriicola jejuensis TaxID=504488 RepID=A0A6P0UCZ2_9FLAO|nr:hypothetical protein [Muriicola jejuensis]NER09779.1 hypothetical protein [Muriicola jejuensis]SMP05853.1 hypothetical protein SAMN06265375_101702 [Muriicola jejuensis]